MRKHLAWYAKGFPNSAEMRNRLMQVNNIDEVKKIIRLFSEVGDQSGKVS
jgi:tRNA-dihydrouridine synthase